VDCPWPRNGQAVTAVRIGRLARCSVTIAFVKVILIQIHAGVVGVLPPLGRKLDISPAPLAVIVRWISSYEISVYRTQPGCAASLVMEKIIPDDIVPGINLQIMMTTAIESIIFYGIAATASIVIRDTNLYAS
jgi:hypothetical protein